MQVTFKPNSGEPDVVFQSEDCSPEYQEYLQMMLEFAQAEDQSEFTATHTAYHNATAEFHDAHVWAYYRANNLAPALNLTYVR
jgi:hypothetical protein